METARPTGPDYLRLSRDFYGDCLFRVRRNHQGESHASANLWMEYKVPWPVLTPCGERRSRNAVQSPRLIPHIRFGRGFCRSLC
jgi:hypothetical protein